MVLLIKVAPLPAGSMPRDGVDSIGVNLSKLAKFKIMQTVDVILPTEDGREPTPSRQTQPEPEHKMLRDSLRLELPTEPLPRFTAMQAKLQTPALAP